MQMNGQKLKESKRKKKCKMKNLFKNGFLLSSVLLAIISCQNKKEDFDASGSFEAEETIISAQVTGTLTNFNLEEGQLLETGQYVGSIDSVQLYLKKKQLEAQIKAIGSKTPQIQMQTGTFKKQLALTQSQINTLLIEKKRTENLLKVDAATRKQLDDINGQLDMLEKQLDVIRNQDIAQTSALSTQKSGLLSERSPLEVQVEQMNDQLSKCRIVNPLKGTVLTKYMETNEMAVTGKPLYKIADLTGIIMRAYITGDQLSTIKLNQKVRVLVDDGRDKYKEYQGVITWISNKAEFTPKTIQTKDERANMVYAIKAIVKNDGFLKIGMYGEVKF